MKPKIFNEVETNVLADSTQYGIELKEVDFKEFDRRKTPRISSYSLFLKSLETPVVEMEFIV